MYAREKSHGVENYNSRKMPSFSSTLLDEIYRSIDGNVEETEDFWAYREKPAKRQGGSSIVKKNTQEEEMATFRKSYMVQKWMENDVTRDKVVSKRRSSLLHDNDSLSFFGSTSSSSNNSGQLSSSSDNEYFGSTKMTQLYTRPKPIRTVITPRENELKQDYKNRDDKIKLGDDLIKSKSRALKIYANLKKVKQPISPGGKLTSLINSLFINANAKKSEHLEKRKKFQDKKSSNSVSSSTCSSASSYSRSCLSKYSPESREKMRNGVKRMVRFHPVSVIVDEDLRPSGRKLIHNQDVDQHRTRSIPRMNKKKDVFSKCESVCNENDDDEEEDEDEDEDAMSDASSDLFELDHLASFADNRYCEELPVYETTQVNRNRAIASGLVH